MFKQTLVLLSRKGDDNVRLEGWMVSMIAAGRDRLPQVRIRVTSGSKASAYSANYLSSIPHDHSHVIFLEPPARE